MSKIRFRLLADTNADMRRSNIQIDSHLNLVNFIAEPTCEIASTIRK